MRRPAPGENPNNLTAAQRRVYNSQFLRQPASSRVDRYGTPNPYANSTNQNPYVGISWLGSGFPHPLPVAPPGTPPDRSFLPLQYAASRPSYDLAGIAALLGPYFRIPQKQDLNLLWKLRETIPMISAAIMRLKELVGFPEVMASERFKSDCDEWLRVLPVNRMQTGAKIWMQSHLDNMATYGRAHAEVILNNARNDVFGLVEVHPTTVGLRPTFGGYATHVVQYQYGGGVPVTLLPELLLSSVNDIRGDDPNGTSMIAELPFVGQILNQMLRSVGQTWERFGTPTYHINWEPPDDWEDPHGDQGKAIGNALMGNLSQALKDRASGKPNDFYTQGKVAITILGAEGEALEFATTGHAIMEQICARFGLPPFMYGFSWASTERMSTAQAKVLTEVIEALRETVTPAIERLVTLRQILVGRAGKFSLRWARVSLQDLIDESRAKLMNAQAEQTEMANWDRKVRLGINSVEEMAQEFRDDLEGLSPQQVRNRLDGEQGRPKLVEELPGFLPAPLGGEAIAPAGGAGEGKPGGRPPGGMPREESTRSLVLEYALNGNGNGKH